MPLILHISSTSENESVDNGMGIVYYLPTDCI